MGKIKESIKAFGKIVDNVMAYEQEVKELTLKLMSRTSGVEYEQAEKIARVLISQAEVTWK